MDEPYDDADDLQAWAMLIDLYNPIEPLDDV